MVEDDEDIDEEDIGEEDDVEESLVEDSFPEVVEGEIRSPIVFVPGSLGLDADTRPLSQTMNPIEEGLESLVPAVDEDKNDDEEDVNKGLYEAVEDKLYEDISEREERIDKFNQAFEVNTLRENFPALDVVGMRGNGVSRDNIRMMRMDAMDAGRERGGSGEGVYHVKDKKETNEKPWEQRDERLKKYRP